MFMDEMVKEMDAVLKSQAEFKNIVYFRYWKQTTDLLFRIIR
ncbi:hypothetical protein Cst_c09190 [Thermoclostridium stercorarium subsp. stercorarium DSM 8532]|uniref:Uncharacterized protein n=1 Tax=Thermoclostridium stercorarium (strain ATCC 35414 / DSM 8532 / NCIMB 11754) TaxID=1121335 RepID=L7VMD9_THES1|nr:hypothetical protein Cst_c09190 [Thermoclostridium stercorarium subsp. stercorarium DSM 8532]